jgi:hypothetical protein
VAQLYSLKKGNNGRENSLICVGRLPLLRERREGSRPSKASHFPDFGIVFRDIC